MYTQYLKDFFSCIYACWVFNVCWSLNCVCYGISLQISTHCSAHTFTNKSPKTWNWSRCEVYRSGAQWINSCCTHHEGRNVAITSQPGSANWQADIINSGGKNNMQSNYKKAWILIYTSAYMADSRYKRLWACDSGPFRKSYPNMSACSRECVNTTNTPTQMRQKEPFSITDKREKRVFQSMFTASHTKSHTTLRFTVERSETLLLLALLLLPARWTSGLTLNWIIIQEGRTAKIISL